MSSKQPYGEPAPFCVFLAEDDQNLRGLMADVLRADGHQVIEASDGGTLLLNLVRRALQRRSLEDRTMVICDIRMPGCDGLSVLRNLREHGPGCPPFVFMTAFPEPGTYEQARQLGALRVLAKPFELEELRAIVRARATAPPSWLDGGPAAAP
jgi:CheY-like chemotaxis protein